MTDAATGEPVEHATVILIGTLHATVTGPDGRFVLDPESAPPFVVEVSAPGFDAAQVDVESGQNIRILLRREYPRPVLRDPLMARKVRLPDMVLGLGSALRMPDIASASGSIDAALAVRGLWSQQLAVMDDDLPVIRTHGTAALMTVLPGDRLLLVSGPYALTWSTGALSAARLERVQQGGQYVSYGIRARELRTAAAPMATWNSAKVGLRIAHLMNAGSNRSLVGMRTQWEYGSTKADVRAGFTAAEQQRASVGVSVRHGVPHKIWRSVSVMASGQRWRNGLAEARILAGRAATRLTGGEALEVELGSDIVHVAPIAGNTQTVAGLFMRTVVVRNEILLDASARYDASSESQLSGALSVSLPMAAEWWAVGGAGTAAHLVEAGDEAPRIWQADFQIRTEESNTGMAVFIRKLEHSSWPAKGTSWGGELWADQSVRRYLAIHGAASVARPLILDCVAYSPVSGAAGLTLSAPRNILRAGVMVWAAAKHEITAGFVTADFWTEIAAPGGLRVRLSLFNASDARNRLELDSPHRNVQERSRAGSNMES